MLISDYLQKNQVIFEKILIAVLQKNSAFLIANKNKKLSRKQINTIDFLYNKYKNGWPLPYLLNNQEFYKLKLKVNQNVLIPRPETEIMIDLILNQYQFLKDKKVNFIDIGTGSGAIILNLAHIFKKKKNYNFYASDISKSALKIAKENAKNIKIDHKIKFIQSDLLENIKLNSNNLIITANLPYLNKEETKHFSLKKEPKLALYGGIDGLDLYRKLFKQLKAFKNNITVFAEINPHQGKELKTIISNNFTKFKIKKHLDLRKKLRFIEVNINNQL